MGATLIAQDQESPSLIVTGANWTCNVPVDARHAELDPTTQAVEAATRAVEVFKGLRNEPRIEMMADYKNDSPALGTVLIVHVKGGDAQKFTLVYTHVCLANAGYYADSVKLHEILKEQTKQVLVEREKQQAAALQDAKDLVLFEKLKDAIVKKSGTKVPKNKKTPARKQKRK